MKLKCPRFNCSTQAIEPNSITDQSLKARRIVRNGYFWRSSDSKRVRRYRCLNCRSSFSRATLSACFGQKKRRLNPLVRKLLISGVSQRQAARILEINPKTVVRKFKFLAHQARLEQRQLLEHFRENPVGLVQFDDLETSEHTKCKPLSVALAVEPGERKILAFQVSQMPAKGLLASVAIQKYGYRKDERVQGWNALMEDLKPLVKEDVSFLSDENPHYPKSVRAHFPKATHKTVQGRRGCVAGQGELKKIGFDPLFALNHTCAMLRAHLNRLFRRTWCTTKKREALEDHIALYVSYHNLQRTQASSTA